MNNIQKDFKRKSQLRCMADGGLSPQVLGSGMAQRAGSALEGRQSRLDAAMEASGLDPRTPAPAPQPKPKPDVQNVEGKVSSTEAPQKGALRRFLGLADGGMGIFSADEMENFNSMGAAGTKGAHALQQQGHRDAMNALAQAQSAPQPGTGYVPPDALEPPEEELADGGDVKGKGGPTDDEVGPVALSNGEYVLPADTVDAVGVENLDALRLATHDFKDADNKPKIDIPGRKGLRGMAAGGVFYVDPEGVATRGPQPGQQLVPRADKLPVPANNSGAFRPQAGPTPTYTGTPVPPKPPSALRAAVQPYAAGAKTTLARAGGGVAAVMAARDMAKNGASIENVGDLTTGAALAARANPITAAAATGWGIGRAVDGLLPASAREAIGGTINEIGLRARRATGVGWGSEDMPNDRMVSEIIGPRPAAGGAPQPKSATPVADAGLRTSNERPAGPGAYNQGLLENRSGLPNSDPRINGSTSEYYNSLPDDAVIGSFNGKQMTKREADARAAGLQTASFMPKQGEASMADQMRSLLREFGAGGGGGGGFAPRSSAKEINERYDKLSSQLSGMYSAKGQGNLARHLVNLENQRASALDADARNLTSARGQDMQAASSAAGNRTSALQAVAGIMERQQAAAERGRADALKARDDSLKVAEERQKNNSAAINAVAETFSAGDKALESSYKELLRTLPSEIRAQADDMTPDEREAFYTNIARQQFGRDEGLVAGRDKGALVQNTILGGLAGRLTRFGRGPAKAVDAALGKVPRVGPVFSALRPAERIAAFGPLLGGAGGALATPDNEPLTRWDPVARDGETGAALPAAQNIREAFAHGAFDVYLNPFDNSVQTVSGRRTNTPTPDEEEAARRYRSALRSE